MILQDPRSSSRSQVEGDCFQPPDSGVVFRENAEGKRPVQKAILLVGPPRTGDAGHEQRRSRFAAQEDDMPDCGLDSTCDTGAYPAGLATSTSTLTC